METVELKPCPFCKCKDIEIIGDFCIVCSECGAEGGYYYDLESAINAWNSRVTEKEKDNAVFQGGERA